MKENQINCFCGRDISFALCCQPFINGDKPAPNAEALMRSRFSAYKVKNYPYILQTYAEQQRQSLSVELLQNHAADTDWLKLEVIQHKHNDPTSAQVEFKAFYQVEEQFYIMHELSDFIKVDGNWFYTQGKVQKGSGEYTPERNSQCLCGSGKKFKKCCAL